MAISLVHELRFTGVPATGIGAIIPANGMNTPLAVGGAPAIPVLSRGGSVNKSALAVLVHIPAPPAGWPPVGAGLEAAMLQEEQTFFHEMFPGETACTRSIHSMALGAHVSGPAMAYVHPPPTMWPGGVCPPAPVVLPAPALVVLGHLRLSHEAAFNIGQPDQQRSWAVQAAAPPAAGLYRKPRKLHHGMHALWGPGASLQFLQYPSLRGQHGCARVLEHPGHAQMVVCVHVCILHCCFFGRVSKGSYAEMFRIGCS